MIMPKLGTSLVYLEWKALGRRVSGLRFNSVERPSKKICIVGSGPAGFYTAQQILKSLGSSYPLQIDMLERLPAPYGLVRYGVAPDHPEVKNCIHKFEELMDSNGGRMEWMGCVSLGDDVSVRTLCQNYDVVALAIGAQKEKLLNVPGEGLRNVYGSMAWTGWINGYPNTSHNVPTLDFGRLNGVDWSSKAVILGNGNVALDVARLLLTPVEGLSSTDISHAALGVLRHSSIRHVNIIGRRGIGQVSFTPAELREIFKLAETQQIQLFCNNLESLRESLQVELFKDEPRPLRSVAKIFASYIDRMQEVSDWNSLLSSSKSSKSLTFSFLQSPIAFSSSSNSVDSETADTISLEENRLDPLKPGQRLASQRVHASGKKHEIRAALFVKCIGYAIGQIPSLPVSLQHPSTGFIKHVAGRVPPNDEGLDNLFVAGWCKSGSTGQLATTLVDANETGQSIIRFIEQLDSSDKHHQEKPGRSWLLPELRKKAVKYLLYEDWRKINQDEIENGKLLQKSREKISDFKGYQHL